MILCPTDCTSAIKPVVFNVCAPEINYSEIQAIYMAQPNTANFADWTSPTEWAARLNQNAYPANYIRTLVVIGDKPAPSPITKEISGNRKITTAKTHVLNWTVDESNATNHAFMQSLECGGATKLWYATKGGLLFGGNAGIAGSTIMDMILNRGNGEIITFNGSSTWESKFTEDRCISPIAGAIATNTFNSSVDFTNSPLLTVAGVTPVSRVGSSDDVQLEFNPITPLTGSDITMTIRINNVLESTFTFKSDYIGSLFRYTDSNAATHLGVFKNGNVNF